MKTQIIRTLSLLLLCLTLLMQAYPVSASNAVAYQTTEFVTADLTEYAFQAAQVDFSKSHLYRDQLVTDDQKALYDLFAGATPDSEIALDIEDLPDLPKTDHPAFTAKLGEYLRELVLAPYAAAIMDTPALFWSAQIGYTCSYGILGNTLVSIRVVCLMLPENDFPIDEYDKMYGEILDVLRGLAFEGGSREGLLRQFHDYLCDTIEYIDSKYAHNIYGALVQGEAVCEGYAKALKLFCDLCDIPCMMITGVAVSKDSGGPHAWNAVRMEDGNWYGIDVTWDDQDETYYEFFLVGSQSVPEHFEKYTFEESHIAKGDFYGTGAVEMSFPTLSKNAYTHTHSYDETVIASPTCKNDGTIEYTCGVCGMTYFETIPAIPHEYIDGVCGMCGAKESQTVYGDCNGDNTITGRDVTRLLQYLANFDPDTGMSSAQVGDGADCNGDGVITGRDVTRLLQYLANYDPDTGKSSVALGK